MDLLIISGFLGSGKTTLLLRIAKTLVEGGRKLAIIENEVGKVGVDDQTVQAEGLTVKELFSGCICCSLRIDLVNTMLELERTCAPDIVIIEPSGVAGPHAVVDAFEGYGGEIDRMIVMHLMDATRPMLLLSKPPLPIVERGVHAGDLILINKIDQATPEAVKSLEDRIREMRPCARVSSVSALTGEGTANLAEAFDMILPPKEKRKAESLKTSEEGRLDTDAVVFSEKISLSFNPVLHQDHVRTELSGLLEALAASLEKAGCRMIGHIKAIIRDEEKAGYLLVSVTDFGAKATARGALKGEIGRASLTLNAIVYGTDSLSLSVAARSHLDNFRIPESRKKNK